MQSTCVSNLTLTLMKSIHQKYDMSSVNPILYFQSNLYLLDICKPIANYNLNELIYF